MPNIYAERLRAHAGELEALDNAHIAIIGVVMRNAADEIDEIESRLQEAELDAKLMGELAASLHVQLKTADSRLGGLQAAVVRALADIEYRGGAWNALRDAYQIALAETSVRKSEPNEGLTPQQLARGERSGRSPE